MVGKRVLPFLLSICMTVTSVPGVNASGSSNVNTDGNIVLTGEIGGVSDTEENDGKEESFDKGKEENQIEDTSDSEEESIEESDNKSETEEEGTEKSSESEGEFSENEKESSEDEEESSENEEESSEDEEESLKESEEESASAGDENESLEESSDQEEESTDKKEEVTEESENEFESVKDEDESIKESSDSEKLPDEETTSEFVEETSDNKINLPNDKDGIGEFENLDSMVFSTKDGTGFTENFEGNEASSNWNVENGYLEVTKIDDTVYTGEEGNYLRLYNSKTQDASFKNITVITKSFKDYNDNEEFPDMKTATVSFDWYFNKFSVEKGYNGYIGLRLKNNSEEVVTLYLGGERKNDGSAAPTTVLTDKTVSENNKEIVSLKSGKVYSVSIVFDFTGSNGNGKKATITVADSESDSGSKIASINTTKIDTLEIFTETSTKNTQFFNVDMGIDNFSVQYEENTEVTIKKVLTQFEKKSISEKTSESTIKSTILPKEVEVCLTNNKTTTANIDTSTWQCSTFDTDKRGYYTWTANIADGTDYMAGGQTISYTIKYEIPLEGHDYQDDFTFAELVSPNANNTSQKVTVENGKTFGPWGREMQKSSGNNNYGDYGFSFEVKEENSDNYLYATVTSAPRGSRLDIDNKKVAGANVSFDWMPVQGEGRVMFLSPDYWHPYLTLEFNKDNEGGKLYYYTENTLPACTTEQTAFDKITTKENANAKAIELGKENKWFTVEVAFDYSKHIADLSIIERDNPSNKVNFAIPIEPEACGMKSFVIQNNTKDVAMGLDNLTVDYTELKEKDIVSVTQPADEIITKDTFGDFQFPTDVNVKLQDGTTMKVNVGTWTADPSFNKEQLDKNPEGDYIWTAPLVLSGDVTNSLELKAHFQMHYLQKLTVAKLKELDIVTVSKKQMEEDEEGMREYQHPLTVNAVLTDGTEMELDINEDTWTSSPAFNIEKRGLYTWTAEVAADTELNPKEENKKVSYIMIYEADYQSEHDYENDFTLSTGDSGFKAWGSGMQQNTQSASGKTEKLGSYGFTFAVKEENENRYLYATVVNAPRGSRLDMSEEKVAGAKMSFDWMPMKGKGRAMFVAPEYWHPYLTLEFNSEGKLYYYTKDTLPNCSTKQTEFEGLIKEENAVDIGLGELDKWFTVNVEFDYLNHTANLTIAEKDNLENKREFKNIPIEPEAYGLRSFVIQNNEKNVEMGLDNLIVDFTRFGANDIVDIIQPEDVMTAKSSYDNFKFPTEVEVKLGNGKSTKISINKTDWTSEPEFSVDKAGEYTWTAELKTSLNNPFGLKASFKMKHTLLPIPMYVHNPNTLELNFGDKWSEEELKKIKTVTAFMSDGTTNKEVEVGEWKAIRPFDSSKEGIYVYGADLVSKEGVYQYDKSMLTVNENHEDEGDQKEEYVYDVYYRISYFEKENNYNRYTRSMEYLKRGVYAITPTENKGTANDSTSNGIFVSWRLLVTEYGKDISFNIYRNGELVNNNPITDKTNYLDLDGKPGDEYVVVKVEDGKEYRSDAVVASGKDYFSIPVQKPDPQPAVDGSLAEYSINDTGVADVDGDGEYEFIVKWYPTNAFDSGKPRYSSPTIFDVYKMDGTALWRLNMGLEMPSGAHFNQFMLYDLDQDGKAELFIKTGDGTISYKPNADGKFDMTDESTIVSYIGDKSVKPGSNIHTGHSKGGNEYVTVFNGLTGKEIDTIKYENTTGEFKDWGVTDKGADSGNRSGRYNIAVAYLPKEEGSSEIIPAVLLNRGYYQKTTMIAYTLRDGKLQKEWNFVAENGTVNAGKGNHNMATGDLDNDGYDEVVIGAMALDHDGSVLWVKDGDEGRDFSGHADTIHLTAMFSADSDQLYVMAPSEERQATLNYSITNAATGARIAGIFLQKADVGRGIAANITPEKGYEFWAAAPNSEIPDQIPSGAIYNVYGGIISETKPRNFSCNWRIYWDGDLLSELADGYNTAGKNGSAAVFKYNWEKNTMDTVRMFKGGITNNTTKNNPCLTADLFGDWREEIVLRDEANTELRVYMTSTPTKYMIYTLMHDPVYRNAVANQNTGYNQPPAVSFYLGEDEEGRDRVLNMELPTYPISYTTNPEETETVDKTELEAEIAKADELKESDYTAESWKVYQEALEAAKTEFNSTASTTTTVEAALEKLQETREALVKKSAETVDKTELEAEIAKADELKESDYTTESWKVYQEALEAAKTEFNNTASTTATVEAALEKLQEAREALVKKSEEPSKPEEPDKTELKDEIAKANGLIESDYTSKSWKAYQEALKAAQEELDSTASTTATIKTALESLQKAREALEKKPEESDKPGAPDKSELKAEIAKAVELKKSDYTAESWNAYQKALEAARNEVNNENSTKESVEKALKDLQKAKQQLVKVVVVETIREVLDNLKNTADVNSTPEEKKEAVEVAVKVIENTLKDIDLTPSETELLDTLKKLENYVEELRGDRTVELKPDRNSTEVKVDYKELSVPFDKSGEIHIQKKTEKPQAFTPTVIKDKKIGKYVTFNFELWVGEKDSTGSWVTREVYKDAFRVPMLITVPIPKEIDSEKPIVVYHIVGGKLKDVAHKMVGNKISFIASSFSDYVIVNETTASEQPSAPNTKPNWDTDDDDDDDDDSSIRFYGIQTRSTGKFFLKKDGVIAKNEWIFYQNHWYYAGANGMLKTGWLQTADSKWYYLLEDCTMATGWKYVNGKWYYLDDKNGDMIEGWKYTGGKWYYLNPVNGDMAVGWKLVNGKWYYLNPINGDMATSWKLVDGKWYYLNPVNGDMATGWIQVKDNWYYLTSQGDCLLDTITPDGYTVDKDGVWIQ